MQKEIIFTVDGLQAIIFDHRGVIGRHHVKQSAYKWAEIEGVPLGGVSYKYAEPEEGLRKWHR